jgi:ABC-2 type transport system ATP-binding protein
MEPRRAPPPVVPGPPALWLTGLVKSFRGRPVVDHLQLAVPPGSFFGLVGPNGAGKTTTLRMVTGLLRPDGGHVEIEGIDVWGRPADQLEVKRRIGVLPEEPRLFDRLSAPALLRFTGQLRRMPTAVIEARSAQLLETLGLTEAGGTLVVDFSQGMRKKIGLAAALLHGPRVLFLDEPFESVDPISARTIRAVLDQHTAAGGTVIFSSHVMELVERLCDAVAILHHGRIVRAGRLDDVRAGRSLDDAFAALVGGVRQPAGDLSWLASSSG